MYTVGTISRDSIKTGVFTTYDDASRDIKVWVKTILSNNTVDKRITTITRNSDDSVVTIREEFYTSDYGKILVFLSKSN